MKPRLLTMLTAVLVLVTGAPGRGAAKDEADKPVPLKDSLEQLNKALATRATANVRFDLTLGDSLPFLRFPAMPYRIEGQDTKVVDYTVLTGRALTLTPQGVGRTRMKLSFGDPGKAAAQWAVTLQVVVKEAPKNDAEKPIPIKDSLDRLAKALDKREDAEIPVSLTPEQSLPLRLKELPFRLMLGDTKVLDYSVEKPPTPSITLQAKGAGRTPLVLWYGDTMDPAKQFVITLKVRVRDKK